MKKSTIWILGVVMGLSFISLLYLQISYIEEMVKMRNEQFDESVKRALMAASKDVESAEVDRWLREDISEAEKRAWEQSSQGKGVVQTQRFTVTAPDGTKYSAIELKTFSNEASELPRAMISRKHGTKTIPQTSRSLADAIKNRYLYQRALLDEVAWQMIYRASDKAIEERVNFKNLDQYLKSGLIDNGIELNYHFKVIDRDGREVYRCSDYSDEGSESSYSQPLFLNDPPARMSIVKIHFPGKQDYIFDSVSFMIPSMIFTFVLLITFIFTIYIVFRQKKLTEMKNDFINNMTHEFKTPISTISLAAQMLKDPAVGKSPAMFQHISGVINDETKRLRFQVEKVLQMSMFDRQKATLKMKELDANELITGVVNTFALKVERYNGKIESELKATDPIIFADEMHITNVIFNLMDNAVKYKRPDVDLQLMVKTWNEPGKLMISVQDNGIGIKKEINYKEVADKAAEADAIIFVGGLSPTLEGEEMPVDLPGFRKGDRTNIDLPHVQAEMLKALKKTGKPVIFVLCSGSTLALPWEAENLDAILEAWYPGQQGGTAVADVLFGDYNPAGRLPLTFYASSNDLPDFEDYDMSNRTYRYFKGKALFPFGHGLSYTIFDYGKAKVDKQNVRAGEGMTLTIPLKNTGKLDGDEVIQVYLRNPADKEGPIKTLRAFRRVSLPAGQTENIRIELPASTFECFNPSTNRMEILPGKYELLYGGTSDEKALQKSGAGGQNGKRGRGAAL